LAIASISMSISITNINSNTIVYY